VLYFAYGSNMDAPQLRERLARHGETLHERRHGILHGYRLEFNKVAARMPWIGFANIVRDPEHCVEGTINRVSPGGLRALDKIELVPLHYARVEVDVVDTLTGAPQRASVYVGNPDMLRPALKPTRDYLAHLLAASDVLSTAYLGRLRAVPCCD